jgi:hypothetical protein
LFCDSLLLGRVYLLLILMSWETQHRAGCEPNGQQRHSLPATTCFMQSYLVSILSWETQHRAAVAPTGDGYDAHCLQRHIFAILLHLRNETETRSQTHGLGHPVSDTRSRTHGLGLTASDTRSRTGLQCYRIRVTRLVGGRQLYCNLRII